MINYRRLLPALGVISLSLASTKAGDIDSPITTSPKQSVLLDPIDENDLDIEFLFYGWAP
ncbi:MAG: hypothetical protein ACI8XO_001486 [Verrucomicrobiales bacterium]|jgi:hypothetical protein